MHLSAEKTTSDAELKVAQERVKVSQEAVISLQKQLEEVMQEAEINSGKYAEDIKSLKTEIERLSSDKNNIMHEVQQYIEKIAVISKEKQARHVIIY